MSSELSMLEAWMESVGITWNRDLISIVNTSPGCSGLALGVRAVRDIAEGESLCEIPKGACISIRATTISDIIEKEELGGGLGLVLAVLHELSLGKESEWAGYLQALPPREYLPVFWSEEEVQLLEGTEAEKKPLLDREHTQEDFEENVLPLLVRYPGRLHSEFITLENFRVAASYVASRAFGIDDYHGDAMVPLADIFNHKASVVELAPGYEVHGAASESSDDELVDDEDDSGDEESSEGEGPELGQEGGEEERRTGEEERGRSHGDGHACNGCCDGSHHKHHQHRHQEEQPSDPRHHTHPTANCERGEQQQQEERPVIMSGGSGGGRPHGIHGITTANGLHLRLEIAILDKDDHLEIVAASAVPRGAEVHNTYGEHGNAELVTKYGFALRENPFTAVALEKEQLVATAKRAKTWKARCQFLEEETEVLDEEEEPFEVLSNGHISPALFVALRVLGADDNEAKQWSGIADALSVSPAAAGAVDGGEGEAGDEGDGSIPAVQIWPVGWEAAQSAEHQQTALAAPTGISETAASQNPGEPSDSQAPTESRSTKLAQLLSQRACKILQEAVQRRLSRYPTSLEEDRQLWEQESQAQQPLEEHQSAVHAALLLRLSEKEVLQGMLQSLQQRQEAQQAEQSQRAKRVLPRQQQGMAGKRQR